MSSHHYSPDTRAFPLVCVCRLSITDTHLLGSLGLIYVSDFGGGGGAVLYPEHFSIYSVTIFKTLRVVQFCNVCLKLVSLSEGVKCNF